MSNSGSIGIFDSGYGGLTVLKEIVRELPSYDYIYLGDNARSPYGTRSFETVYQYTLEAVQWLFSKGCRLVILACNTASAKALRSIQQHDLQVIGPSNRVLGIIRPVTEIIGNYSKTNHVGIFGTSGTVNSQSYLIEIAKFFPHLIVTQEACPMWVPLVESFEHETDGADFFVKKHIDQLLKKDPSIDTVVLGCTHYPLLYKKIRKYLPSNINIVSQGEIVAKGLSQYLARHPEIEAACRKNNQVSFCTTETVDTFTTYASVFYGNSIQATQVKWR